jgi:hypothetical protein
VLKPRRLDLTRGNECGSITVPRAIEIAKPICPRIALDYFRTQTSPPKCDITSDIVSDERWI